MLSKRSQSQKTAYYKIPCFIVMFIQICFRKGKIGRTESRWVAVRENRQGQGLTTKWLKGKKKKENKRMKAC